MPLRKLALIVAVEEGNGIGKDGSLPWRFPADAKHFANATTKTIDPNKQNAVIMTRKVWESIPSSRRPLSNRVNVVLSRTIPPSTTDKNLIFASSLEDALKTLEQREDIERGWNLGGTSLYEEGIRKNLVDKIFLTRIHAKFECDVFFPESLLDGYDLVETVDCDDKDVRLSFETWQKSAN